MTSGLSERKGIVRSRSSSPASDGAGSPSAGAVSWWPSRRGSATARGRSIRPSFDGMGPPGGSGAARRQGVLQGIAAVSAEEAWAVGSSPGTRNGVNRALVQRYDGAGWSIVEGPGIPGSDVLMGAAAAPDGSVWAVGYRDTANRRATLIGRGSVTCA